MSNDIFLYNSKFNTEKSLMVFAEMYLHRTLIGAKIAIVKITTF